MAELLADRRAAGIAFSEDHEENGAELLNAACRMNLEGIVAKRKGSRYSSGRSRHWPKIKNPDFRRPQSAALTNPD